jgi:hypothetical protein
MAFWFKLCNNSPHFIIAFSLFSNATAETTNGISTGSGTQTRALELTSSAEALLLTQTEPITDVSTTQLGRNEFTLQTRSSCFF